MTSGSHRFIFSGILEPLATVPALWHPQSLNILRWMHSHFRGHWEWQWERAHLPPLSSAPWLVPSQTVHQPLLCDIYQKYNIIPNWAAQGSVPPLHEATSWTVCYCSRRNHLMLMCPVSHAVSSLHGNHPGVKWSVSFWAGCKPLAAITHSSYRTGAKTQENRYRKKLKMFTIVCMASTTRKVVINLKEKFYS